MPCYDPRDEDDNKIARDRLNLATRLLCGVLGHVPTTWEMNLLYSQVPGLREWWSEHQELDRQRG